MGWISSTIDSPDANDRQDHRDPRRSPRLPGGPDRQRQYECPKHLEEHRSGATLLHEGVDQDAEQLDYEQDRGRMARNPSRHSVWSVRPLMHTSQVRMLDSPSSAHHSIRRPWAAEATLVDANPQKLADKSAA